jgi:flavoprotein
MSGWAQHGYKAPRTFRLGMGRYDLLVVQRGWSLPRFARFLADYMIPALLAPAH